MFSFFREKLHGDNWNLVDAAVHNNHRLAKRLLSKGINPDQGHDKTPPPLHIAAKHNSCDVAELLIDAGADIDLSFDGFPPHSGVTPLHFCTMDPGGPDVALILLQNGAEVNAIHHNGEMGGTPLDSAIVSEGIDEDRKKKLIYTLLQYGAKSIRDL